MTVLCYIICIVIIGLSCRMVPLTSPADIPSMWHALLGQQQSFPQKYSAIHRSGNCSAQRLG